MSYPSNSTGQPQSIRFLLRTSYLSLPHFFSLTSEISWNLHPHWFHYLRRGGMALYFTPLFQEAVIVFDTSFLYKHALLSPGLQFGWSSRLPVDTTALYDHVRKSEGSASLSFGFAGKCQGRSTSSLQRPQISISIRTSGGGNMMNDINSFL